MKDIVIQEGVVTRSRVTITNSEIRLKISERDLTYKEEILEKVKWLNDKIQDFPFTLRIHIRNDNGNIYFGSLLKNNKTYYISIINKILDRF